MKQHPTRLHACTCALALAAGCDRVAPRSDGGVPAFASTASTAAEPSTPFASASRPPSPPAYVTPLPIRARSDSAPAKTYAALPAGDCSAELRKRALNVRPAKGKTPGLELPLQLTGPLHGVAFQMPRGLYGFIDCRLALLLDDLAKKLAALGVSAVIVNNTYRPGSILQSKVRRAPESAPSTLAGSKRGKGRAQKPTAADPAQLSQHARGLAIDIMEFRLTDGRSLNVERDWQGTLGAPPCGPDARVNPGESHAAAERLRDLVCAVARAGFCNHLITPNRDAAHHNHLHCDIEANASEVMIE